MKGMVVRYLSGMTITCLLLSAAHSSPAAEEGIMTGMTEAHNAVRAGLGLPEVAWSNELAESAGEWAQYLAENNNCRMQHRPSQGENAAPYGGNLFRATATEFSTGAREVQNITPQHIVKAWASESQYYDYEKNSCQAGKLCGHYKQIVWEDTRLIGCGMAVCQDKSQVWVCHYDPPGNIAGQKPY